MASIEQRASGNWSVYWRNQGRKGKQRVTLGPDTEALAKRIQNVVNSRGNKVTSDEIERLFNLVVEVDEVGDVSLATPTVREWSTRWLETRTRIGGGTRRDYTAKLNNVILPAIGDLRLDAVRGSNIADILNGILDAWSRTTADRYYEVMRSLFRFAYTEGHIPRNIVVTDTDWVHGLPAEDDIEDDDDGHVYLTKPQFHLLRAAAPPDIVIFIDYLAATGCRFSEATAVEVRDLNLSEQTIRVRRAWKKDEAGRYFKGTTKGRRARTLHIGSVLAERLEEKVEGKASDVTVFGAPKGGPWRGPNFRVRRWLPMIGAARRCTAHPPERPAKGPTGPARNWRPDEVSACDCPGRLKVAPTPHDLRHSYTAWQIAAGKPIAAISRSLGHATTEVTELVYAGILPEVRQSLGEVTDAILIPD